MSKEQKITEEQLKTILDSQKELNATLANVGILSAQKYQLTEKAIEEGKKMEEFKAELEKEYGKVNINLKDGTYEVIEDEDEASAE